MAESASNSDSEVVDYVLSCSESSYEVEEPDSEREEPPERADGALPYRFEPYASAESDEASGESDSADSGEGADDRRIPRDFQRLNNTEWFVSSEYSTRY